MILNMNMFCFENREDSNQLASEKPADLDPNCLPICFEVLHMHDIFSCGGKEVFFPAKATLHNGNIIMKIA